MADENEINKEESATSLTRDSSSQVRGNKYSLRNRRSQINAVNVPAPDKDKDHKNKQRKPWNEKNALEKAASTVARELRKAAKGVKDVGREMKQTVRWLVWHKFRLNRF